MSDGGFLPPVVAVLDANILAFTAGMTTAGEGMASLSVPFERLDAQAQLTVLEMNKVGAAAEMMATENALAMEKMSADTAAMSAKMEMAATKAEASTAAVGDAMAGTAAKAELMNKRTSTAVMGIGVVAAAVIGVSADLAAKFETQMTRLYTAAGAPKQAVLDSYDTVLKIGNDVGQTGIKMAEALYHPISAGLDMATALNVVRYSAEEAAISGANLDDTTYALSSVMKAFNQSAADAEPTMATLNAIVGEGDMRFQDFNQSVKNWAPTAAQMGISIQSMGAGLAYLTDRGNSAEVAATRMTMGITMMSTPSKQAGTLLKALGVASGDVTASSSLMESALKKAGITQNQLAMDLKKPDGLYVALSDLKDHLTSAGVSGTEADSTLSKIFGGGRSDKAIMSLMQNLDGLKEKYDAIGKDSSVSKFEQNWKDASSTFSFKMHDMVATLENLGIKIGTIVLPVLTKLAGWFVDAITWISNNKAAMIALIAVLTGALIVAISAVGVALWSLAANPVVWIVAAIIVAVAALAFGLYELITHLKEVGDFFAWLWNTVWKWTSDRVTDIVNFLVSTFNTVIDWIVARWNGFIGFWVDLWNQVWKWCSDRVSDVVNFITSTFSSIVSWIVSTWESIPGFFKNLWSKVMQFFSDLPGKIGYELGFALGSVIKWSISLARTIGDGIQKAVEWFVSLGPKIVTALGNAGSWLLQKGKDLVTGLWNGITTAAKAVWAWLQALPGNIKNFFSSVGSWLLSSGNSLITGLWNGITTAAKTVWSWLQALPGRIKAFFSAAPGWLLSHGRDILNGLLNGITSAATAVWNWFRGVWRSITGFFSGAGGWLYSAGRDILNGLLNGIMSAGSWVIQKAKDFATGLLNGIKSALGINSPSRHTHAMGQGIVEGLVNGLNSDAHTATKAAQNMVDSVLGAAGQASRKPLTINGSLSGGAILAAAGRNSASQGTSVTIQMNPRDVAQWLQTGTLRYNLRNPSNGLSVKGA